MVVVVEDNVIDVDQSSVDRRFKLSFVVSFNDNQLPNFQAIEEPRIGQCMMSHLHF